MKTLEIDENIGCDATAVIDWKEGGDAFLQAFDRQLKEFNLEVISYDTQQDTSAWKIQRMVNIEVR